MTHLDSEDAGILTVVRDVLGGQRHSRRTIVQQMGRSYSTADRWIDQIVQALHPRIERKREGKTTWLVCNEQQERPTKTATVGACVAACLASIFEGSQHERNLKDARDYLLKLRGLAYGELDRKFFFATKGGELALPDAREDLDEVIDAVLESNLLAFSYRHGDGTAEDLCLKPMTLVIFNQQFYVLALRVDGSPYCYRFARMSNVERRQQTFTYPSRNEFDPRAIFAPAFGIHIAVDGPIEDVEILVSGPWAKFATTHRWHPTQRVQPRADGSVLVTLQVRLCPEVESWVLSFGEHAAVVKPVRLRKAVGDRLRRAAAKYVKPGPRKVRSLIAALKGPGVSRSRGESQPEKVTTETRGRQKALTGMDR